MKLLMLKGLPASGKSTYAKRLVQEGWVEVNRDDLRKELITGKWNPRKERKVIKARNERIRAALEAGKNVVNSDTNLHPKNEATMRNVASEYSVEFQVKFFEIDLATAVERDLGRKDSVGERVIRQMWERYIRPTLVVEQDPNLPHCILVDVDGTLAHMQGRHPYDWKRVKEDVVDDTVRELVEMYSNYYHIIVLTGRDGVCYKDSQEWLELNRIPFDKFYSRAEGDNRPDHIIKRELYDEHIAGKYYVRAFIDDRQQVVDMWRDMGFKVFQVADGNF